MANRIGIYTLNDLKEVGAVDCCLILTYTIEGAIHNIHWARLPDNTKQQPRKALAK